MITNRVSRLWICIQWPFSCRNFQILSYKRVAAWVCSFNSSPLQHDAVSMSSLTSTKRCSPNWHHWTGVWSSCGVTSSRAECHITLSGGASVLVCKALLTVEASAGNASNAVQVNATWAVHQLPDAQPVRLQRHVSKRLDGHKSTFSLWCVKQLRRWSSSEFCLPIFYHRMSCSFGLRQTAVLSSPLPLWAASHTAEPRCFARLSIVVLKK